MSKEKNSKEMSEEMNKKLDKEYKEKISSENKMRQIVIETDGNGVKIVKSEVAGTIEFIGILQSLIEYARSTNK